ncbi:MULTISPECIES: hypothetical protein [unclassified Leptolyngbya]|uniref:hypothetical protein n=1 Tax=unclassified Leptolyngbya TaxID=2650499 RepID=UPI00168452D3|nr:MULTISPECIES: hypothetical protein [unclassified Leptolyngbya]MBD1909382.1 hypothetical protein [Leptolyngbya sp. FACHB-8]MBD2158659.1 hypothetical protein [Leptolyngbya sp. FACHB-16]
MSSLGHIPHVIDLTGLSDWVNEQVELGDASNSQYGHQSQEFTPYGRELLALMPENRAPLARGFRA